MKAKGTELFTCLDLSEEGEKGRKIKSFRPVPLSSRNKVFVRKEYVEETDEKLVWWELNVLGRREGPHNTGFWGFLMVRMKHKPDSSKSLYTAQNMTSGHSHRKGNSSASEDGLFAYLHPLSQQNGECLPLTPGRVHIKTLKNPELILLLQPAQSAANFFLALTQR